MPILRFVEQDDLAVHVPFEEEPEHLRGCVPWVDWRETTETDDDAANDRAAIGARPEAKRVP